MKDRFLKQPELKFFEENGKPYAAYLKLQARKAVRDVQPDPGVLFYLDEDDLPVGVKFYAPVCGVAVFKILDEMVMGPGGEPRAMDRRVEHEFRKWDAQDLSSIIRGMAKASEKLTDREAVGC